MCVGREWFKCSTHIYTSLCSCACVCMCFINICVYTHTHIVCWMPQATTWISSGIWKHKRIEIVIGVLVHIQFLSFQFIWSQLYWWVDGIPFPTEIRCVSTLKRWANCFALLCCSQRQVFNCQPFRLTLGCENLDKSLFVIAFLQAKWCFHLQLCNRMSRLAAVGRGGAGKGCLWTKHSW